jgi:hypothetical protein
MNTTLYIVVGHLGCFHNLAIMNSVKSTILKITVKKVKMQTTDWRKYFQNIPSKDLFVRICKKFLHLNNNMIKILI